MKGSGNQGQQQSTAAITSTAHVLHTLAVEAPGEQLERSGYICVSLLHVQDSGLCALPYLVPCSSVGMKIRQDELEMMISEIDTDGSGEVEFDEFVAVSGGKGATEELTGGKEEVVHRLALHNQFQGPLSALRWLLPRKVMTKSHELAFDKQDIMRAFKILAGDKDPDGLITPEVLEKALVGSCTCTGLRLLPLPSAAPLSCCCLAFLLPCTEALYYHLPSSLLLTCLYSFPIHLAAEALCQQGARGGDSAINAWLGDDGRWVLQLRTKGVKHVWTPAL